MEIIQHDGNRNGVEMPPKRAIINKDDDAADNILQEVVLHQWFEQRHMFVQFVKISRTYFLVALS